jgi:hypothetical protein
MKVKGKREARRRSDGAELWRTAFAREPDDVLDLVQVGWPASRSSGVSRAKAGGEGSRTPVSCCHVHQRPRMLYQSHLRGKYVLMNKRGRRRMLLVLLLAVASVWKHPEIAVLDRLFP